uniref:Uncharacterized protein n=1 Tax=Cacopsylla melanoneura TaxID=428564 RepID=A0A8D8TFW3_9HEMI
MIEQRNKTIRRYKQRSILAKKRVVKLTIVIKEIKDKFNFIEDCVVLNGISPTSNFLVRRQIQKAQGKRMLFLIITGLFEGYTIIGDSKAKNVVRPVESNDGRHCPGVSTAETIWRRKGCRDGRGGHSQKGKLQ